MSLRLEMLQVARLAPKALESSTELVRGFYERQLNDDGGFRDRRGQSDLYYTVFGLEGLLALGADLPRERIESYLRTFEDGQRLDFVHNACLARAWAGIGAQRLPSSWREEIVARVASYRTSDGGFHPLPDSRFGTAYGCFLALGLYQDLGAEPPATESMLAFLRSLRREDGGYANEPSLPFSATPATAAVLSVLRNLAEAPEPAAGDWLLERFHAQGGFVAVRGAPLPDLLSTAVALHALSGLQRDLSDVREPCLDFLDTLWTNEGAFHGNWADHEVDCEYTYYGLLALGHLS